MGGRASFDLNQLPDVAQIERIEVVKGHGGALYGSDAVGGVVNIITKKLTINLVNAPLLWVPTKQEISNLFMHSKRQNRCNFIWF
ncbi:MAG: TonB-dependent receptor [Phascolarctobacterium sp.]